MRCQNVGSRCVGMGSSLRNLARRSWLPAVHLAAVAAVLFVSVFLCPAMVQATTYTWNLAGTDWATAGDWTNLAVPDSSGSSDVAWFNSGNYSSAQPNLAQTNSIGGLWSTGAGALNLGGSTLTINGATVHGNATTGIELDSGAGAMTVSTPIIFPSTVGSQTWYNNSANALTVNGPVNLGTGMQLTLSGSGTVNFTGPISGNSLGVATGLIINGTSGGNVGSGAGQLVTLTGSNTYTGQTIVNAGTLQIGNSGSGEAFASSVVTIGAGTTLAFSHSDNIAVPSLILGYGGVTKTGAGVLTLGSTSAAGQGLTSGLTYSGPTAINGGTLQMASGVSNLPISVAINNSGNPNNGGTATFLGSALSITSTDSGAWNSGKTNTGGYFTYIPVSTSDNFTAVVHVTNVAGGAGPVL